MKMKTKNSSAKKEGIGNKMKLKSVQTKKGNAVVKSQPKAVQTKNDGIDSRIKEIPEDMRNVFLYLVSEKIIDIKKIEFKGNSENYVKQKIEDSINEKYQILNERFSELRKSGVDLGVLNFKLITVSLKIKIFFATYDKKDAENLINRIKEIEKEINKLKI